MRVALLYPHFQHPAIEERYGAWQAQLFLRRAYDWTEWITYVPGQRIADSMVGAESEYCLVVTDPLLLTRRPIVEILAGGLGDGVAAALPVTNEPENEAQRAAVHDPYLTIRQFEEAAADYARGAEPPRTVKWTGDPGLFLSRTDYLVTRGQPATEALADATVAVMPAAYVHRWTRLRSQRRSDLLPYVPEAARSVLEFGCAEGLLGEEIKRRQECRFVGIEIDQPAAAAARKRLDDVYCGDATHLVSTLDERFDCIVGGDVLEHIDDPWSFLISLREIAAPGGSLLLSIPNIANWAIVTDLLSNRFDYAYIAITCAGHLRFFSRNTIVDALEIAGWRVMTIDPQPSITSRETESFIARLTASGLANGGEHLMAPGYYVVARNE